MWRKPCDTVRLLPRDFYIDARTTARSKGNSSVAPGSTAAHCANNSLSRARTRASSLPVNSRGAITFAASRAAEKRTWSLNSASDLFCPVNLSRSRAHTRASICRASAGIGPRGHGIAKSEISQPLAINP